MRTGGRSIRSRPTSTSAGWGRSGRCSSARRWSPRSARVSRCWPSMTVIPWWFGREASLLPPSIPRWPETHGFTPGSWKWHPRGPCIPKGSEEGDVRPLEMGPDQEEEVRHRREAGADVLQAASGHRGSCQGGRSERRREHDPGVGGPEGPRLLRPGRQHRTSHQAWSGGGRGARYEEVTYEG